MSIACSIVTLLVLMTHMVSGGDKVLLSFLFEIFDAFVENCVFCKPSTCVSTYSYLFS